MTTMYVYLLIPTGWRVTTGRRKVPENYTRITKLLDNWRDLPVQAYTVYELFGEEFDSACQKLSEFPGMTYNPDKKKISVSRTKFFKEPLKEVKRLAKEISKWNMRGFYDLATVGMYDLEQAYDNFHNIFIFDGRFPNSNIEPLDKYIRDTRDTRTFCVKKVFACEGDSLHDSFIFSNRPACTPIRGRY